MQEKALAHGFPYFRSTGGLRGVQNSCRRVRGVFGGFFKGEKG